jgi:hypothetical protein
MSVPETRSAPRFSVTLTSASALLCVLVALTVLFLFEPGRYTFYPRCLFHQTTGLLCPGCGSLRAAHQLLHGHVMEAFRLNALLVLALPATAWLLLRKFVRNRNNQVGAFHSAWLWTALAIGMLFGVIRNLPFAQAFWLAP